MLLKSVNQSKLYSVFIIFPPIIKVISECMCRNIYKLIWLNEFLTARKRNIEILASIQSRFLCPSAESGLLVFIHLIVSFSNSSRLYQYLYYLSNFSCKSSYIYTSIIYISISCLGYIRLCNYFSLFRFILVLVSLFNGISNFMGYLMPKPSL